VKKLHIFILKSFIGPFILTFFISLFILLMQFLWKYIEDLVGKGLDWTVIAELLAYAAAGLVPMALPLAVLLASIMTFGNLGENYELTALKSSGISLPRIMMPLIIFIVMICTSAFFFSNNVLPITNLKMGAILFDVSKKRPEFNIKEGIFNNDIENLTIRVESKNLERNMMYGFMLYDHSGFRGNVKVIVADSAQMLITKDERYMILTLYSGKQYEEVEERPRGMERSYPHRTDYFKEQQVLISLAGFEFTKTDEDLFKSNYQMMNISQLSSAVDSLSEIVEYRSTRFYRSMERTKYFKNEAKPTVHDSVENVWIDTVYTIRQVEDIDSIYVPMNLDSLYNTFDKAQKTRVLSNALAYARVTSDEAERTTEELDNRVRYIRRHNIEWHKKFALSFACFIFFFIGAPLGAIIRKGGLGMPVVISILFFILYYVISLTGDKFAREGVWLPQIGMWLSSYILLPLGIFLTYKAATDSVILNIDSYFDAFKKLFSKKVKKLQ